MSTDYARCVRCLVPMSFSHSHVVSPTPMISDNSFSFEDNTTEDVPHSSFLMFVR